MYQSGSLLKRRCKTLAKVKGLSRVPYNETLDSFRGFVNTDDFTENCSSQLSPDHNTTLRVSSSKMVEYRRNANISSRIRITRDPTMHRAYDIENIRSDSEVTRNDIESGTSDPQLDGINYVGIQSQDQGILIDKEHFLKNSAIQVLRYIVFLDTIFAGMPWKWNQRKQRIQRRGSICVKIWHWQLIIGSIQTLIIFYLQVKVFVQKLYSEDTSNRSAFMGTFGIAWSGMVLGKNWTMYSYAEKMRIYINALLVFNQKHVKSYVVQLDGCKYRGGIMLNPLFFLIVLIQIPVRMSLFIRMPFQPWYLFSYVNPKPWYWMVPGAIHEAFMVGQAITFDVLIPWVLAAHTNSLRFWLCELHNNNDSDYTSENLRNPRNAFAIYKALNILNIMFNDCMAPVAIPAMILLWTASLVPCGYVMVRSMNQKFIDDLPGIISFPLTIANVSIKLFYLSSLSAEVFDLGCSFLHSWSQTKQKDFRRILMSCPTLKIWSRNFYFFTCDTTLNFFASIFGYITDCVITFP